MENASAMSSQHNDAARSGNFAPGDSFDMADSVSSREDRRNQRDEAVAHHIDGHFYEDEDLDNLQRPDTPSSLDYAMPQYSHDNVASTASSSVTNVSPIILEDPPRRQLRCCYYHKSHQSPLFSAATGALMRHCEIAIINHYSSSSPRNDTAFGGVVGEQAYINPPSSNSLLNLSNMPFDIKMFLMTSMERVPATVLGLTCASLYAAYSKVHHNLLKYPRKVKLTDGIFLKCPDCDLIKRIQLTTLLAKWAPLNLKYNPKTGKWVELRFPVKYWGFKIKNIPAVVKTKINNSKAVVKFSKIMGMKKIENTDADMERET